MVYSTSPIIFVIHYLCQKRQNLVSNNFTYNFINLRYNKDDNTDKLVKFEILIKYIYIYLKTSECRGGGVYRVDLIVIVLGFLTGDREEDVRHLSTNIYICIYIHYIYSLHSQKVFGLHNFFLISISLFDVTFFSCTPPVLSNLVLRP